LKTNFVSAAPATDLVISRYKFNCDRVSKKTIGWFEQRLLRKQDNLKESHEKLHYSLGDQLLDFLVPELRSLETSSKGTFRLPAASANR